MGLQEVLHFILDKLKEALFALESLGRHILAWFDHVFPPETRGDKISHWFHVALPYLIAAVVVISLFFICRCCCRCCCAGGRGRMMKAPGRNCHMERSVFESDPRGYFQRLRSHPGDELV